jgi:hypothetical protein
MLLLGAHRMNKGQFDAGICGRIVANQALLVGGGATHFGAGAYAYYADTVPVRFRSDPFAVFQVAYQRMQADVRHVRVPGSFITADQPFFVLLAPVGRMIPIDLLGFVNCPNFPTYPGTLVYL